jgi:hypothetical protein
MIENYMEHCDWKPTQDIGIIIDDKNGCERTEKELSEMIEKIRDVAGDYGFDLHIWGSGHLTGFIRLPIQKEEDSEVDV